MAEVAVEVVVAVRQAETRSAVLRVRRAASARMVVAQSLEQPELRAPPGQTLVEPDRRPRIRPVVAAAGLMMATLAMALAGLAVPVRSGIVRTVLGAAAVAMRTPTAAARPTRLEPGDYTVGVALVAAMGVTPASARGRRGLS